MIRVCLLSMIILCACQSKASFADKAIMSYCAAADGNDLVELPIRHYTQNKEAVWQFLNRATIRLAQGNASDSIGDYLTALDASDFYRKKLLQEHMAQWLIDDAQAPYIAAPDEALLARFMAACACFQSGDPKNGIALLRQAIELQSLQNELSSIDEHEFHPLINYLLAMAMEYEGDVSQARLLYHRLGIDESKMAKDKAHVAFVVYDRVIPQKRSEIAPASIVSLQLLELLLKTTGIKPALSSLSGIAIPVFPKQPFSFPLPVLSIDGEPIDPTLTYDVFCSAKTELNRQIPYIAARAAARQLIRRAGTGYAYEKDKTVGTIVDIGMLIGNLMTSADTRMWNTLPQEISLFRKDLDPGSYSISLSNGKEQTLRVQAGELVVVQIFRPHGHETQFLIPNKGAI